MAKTDKKAEKASNDQIKENKEKWADIKEKAVKTGVIPDNLPADKDLMLRSAIQANKLSIQEVEKRKALIMHRRGLNADCDFWRDFLVYKAYGKDGLGYKNKTEYIEKCWADYIKDFPSTEKGVKSVLNLFDYQVRISEEKLQGDNSNQEKTPKTTFEVTKERLVNGIEKEKFSYAELKNLGGIIKNALTTMSKKDVVTATAVNQ